MRVEWEHKVCFRCEVDRIHATGMKKDIFLFDPHVLISPKSEIIYKTGTLLVISDIVISLMCISVHFCFASVGGSRCCLPAFWTQFLGPRCDHALRDPRRAFTAVCITHHLLPAQHPSPGTQVHSSGWMYPGNTKITLCVWSQSLQKSMWPSHYNTALHCLKRLCLCLRVKAYINEISLKC